jgi:hypothetical protein
MPNELAERLRGYTDEQLARAKADRSEFDLQVILTNEEHEFNLKLIADPVRWITFSTILGSATALIGATAGILLAWWLQST